MIYTHRLIDRFAVTLFAMVWLTLSGASAVAQEVAQEVATAGPVAIVVHKDTDIDNLSLFEVRSIFLANQQFWPDRTRIILLVRAPKSEERDFILNTIYEMDEAQFRQYWIAKMFRAEVPRGPKVVFSIGMMLELVIAIPGSISFVSIDEVTDGVKVVKIDGMLPTDPGYPLK
jgi:ABC-type phosphate transport system substrate-binding protein